MSRSPTGATERHSPPSAASGSSVGLDATTMAGLRAYTAFVPSLVTERIAKDPSVSGEAYEEEFPAALLFVDIVGYVKLTGQTHKGVVERERRGTAMERLQNREDVAGGGRLGDVMGIAGLTGKEM